MIEKWVPEKEFEPIWTVLKIIQVGKTLNVRYFKSGVAELLHTELWFWWSHEEA